MVKDAAATLLVRLVYLRLLEARELTATKVVTGGWASPGYQDFREAAPELVRADETEGYQMLLALLFDDLAHDLPGLYGPVRLTGLVPVARIDAPGRHRRTRRPRIGRLCGATTPPSAGYTSTGTTPSARPWTQS